MNYCEESYRQDLRKRLDDFRLEHSREVAKTARLLAVRYGGDPEKAYYAGLLHDIFKNEKKEDVLLYFADHGVTLSACERSAPKLWHAMAGAMYLRETYGFDDEFIDAVRYHTTGREEMTKLDRILFTADFISADRSYPGVEDMRERAKVSLECAMEEGLRFTIAELANALHPIHPDTIAAFNSILLELK